MKIKNKKITQELAWLIGFFTGDGYITYGRVAADTITPEIAEKVFKEISKLTRKSIKVEVYGDPKKFERILPTKFFKYPKKKGNTSDCAKLRVDSVRFSRFFRLLLQEFLEKILEGERKLQSSFLQGFFDAEGTVSPDGTIQIDMQLKNWPLISLISKLLNKFGINNSYRKYKKKCRLVVFGGTKHIDNLKKFQKIVNFSIPLKRRELEIITRVYSTPKEKRSKKELCALILDTITKEKEIELKELMMRLNIKYDVLKKCLRILLKERKIMKIKKHKHVYLSTPSSGSIGK